MLVLDEYTRECPALEVDRSVTSGDVTRVLDRLIAERGAPAFIRSDSGPELIAEAVRDHLADLEIKTRFIAPGAPRENGQVESTGGTLRTDLLNREVFGHSLEAKVLGEQYRQEYNTERPHSALNYQTPGEFAASHMGSSALTSALT